MRSTYKKLKLDDSENHNTQIKIIYNNLKKKRKGIMNTSQEDDALKEHNISSQKDHAPKE